MTIYCSKPAESKCWCRGACAANPEVYFHHQRWRLTGNRSIMRVIQGASVKICHDQNSDFLELTWRIASLGNFLNSYEMFVFIRPPDIVVGGLRFYRDSSSSSSSVFCLFSSATLRALWTELNQNRPYPFTWVRFKNACPICMVYPRVSWICRTGKCPPPKSRGPKTSFFRRLCNLTASLTAYTFGTKHDIHNRASILETTCGLLDSHVVSKCRNFGLQTP